MTRFSHSDTDEQLADFAAAFPGAKADARGRTFGIDGSAARLYVPFLLLPPHANEAIESYRARVQLRTTSYAIVLLQAGAMAMGLWDEGVLVSHKAQKRYVVRGNGKAQPTHLRTRGKSRYGSRLRLQNWLLLLAEVSLRWRQWHEQHGPAEQVFVAALPRTLGALWKQDPRPPLDRDDPRLRRIPLHVHVPDHEELLRVQRWLQSGRLELPPV
ncbi:MAG: hypothetical protein ABL997_06515 [Planctomycetota bacterium]